MGFFLKNPSLNQHNTVMPLGPTAEREAYPKSGSFRFNTDAGKLEVYDGTKWFYTSIAGLAAVTKDSFTGDAVQTEFVLSKTVVSVYDVVVFIGNVYQNPAVAYTVSGSNPSTLTFTSAPPLKNTVVVLHGLNNTSA
jgi:hypothetical protein